MRRVDLKLTVTRGPDRVNWSVEATDFEYHRNGEVRMIIQRTWDEHSGVVSSDQLVSCVIEIDTTLSECRFVLELSLGRTQ